MSENNDKTQGELLELDIRIKIHRMPTGRFKVVVTRDGGYDPVFVSYGDTAHGILALAADYYDDIAGLRFDDEVGG